MTAPRNKRQLFIEVAIEVIGQRGYYGFSLQEVADRSGVTVAGVLHHFKTKTGLLLAVLEERDRRDLEVLSGATDVDPAAIQTIEAFVQVVRRLVRHNAGQPELVRLYSVLRNEALQDSHPAFQFFRQRDSLTVGYAAHALTGVVARPRPAARAVLALIGGYEDLWLRFPTTVNLSAETVNAVEALLRGLPPAVTQQR